MPDDWDRSSDRQKPLRQEILYALWSIREFIMYWRECHYLLLCLVTESLCIYLIQVPKEESEQDFDQKYFGAYKNLNKESKESRVSGTSEQQGSTAQDGTSSKTNEVARTSSILKQKGESVQISDETQEQRPSMISDMVRQERSSSVKSQVLFQPQPSEQIHDIRASVRLR